MENIIVKLDAETAGKWKTASPKIRRYLLKSFKEQIAALDRMEKEAKLEKTLQKMRREAAENGLTEELLEELLHE